jgi:shikimate dehydrogenase
LLHSSIFYQLGLDHSYELKELKKEDLESFVSRNRYFGYNVTIPYKKTIFNHINEFENSCEDIGSVNCIFKGKGYNTDWKGFVLSLKKNDIDVSQKKCAIIGAGATAKSIAYALIELRCKSISIYNRTHENRISLENWIRYKIKTYNTKNFDIIINCTSLGMWPNVLESPMIKFITSKDQIFYDVIYNPKSTKFLSNAKKLGHEIENGKMMFIYQACAAFEKWHNIRPQVDTKTIELLDQ